MNLTLGIDDNISKALDQLANKLGTTVDEVAKYMVSYIYALGVTDLVTAGVIWVLVLFGFFLGLYLLFKKTDCVGESLGVLLLAALLVLPAVCWTRSGVVKVMAPQGAAIVEAVQLMHGAGNSNKR